MVYKSGKLKGELTTPEIRKLISAHNKLTDIKIKKGATRDDIIKLLKNNGWSVDHEKQSLIPLDRPRKKIITLKEADTITKPKPKTELQKQKLKEKKEEKEVEKKKEVREIKKKAIEEQKAIPKPKPKSKPKEEPKPKPKPVKKQTFNLKNNKVISGKSPPKPKPKEVPKDSHVMPDSSIMKNKDMPQKDSNPFIGKSTAPNAKPTYKPKPKPKPSPKPKSVKPPPKQDTSEIDTYDKLSKFVMDRTRKSTFEIGDWIKKNKSTKFKSKKELFKAADNFIKPIMNPLFDMIEKALEGDKPFINNSQYETLDTLVERVREYMRDKRSELQKNIETEPVEEQK
tara:strand:- start:1134 stop:2156 length:1023 start_codon:yes stop_codon:yes gene_type:complete